MIHEELTDVCAEEVYAVEIRQLAAFIAVSEELHFGHAAARLGISQSALSRQLQSLERQLGVRLVVRGPHISLTDAGENVRR